MIEVEIKLPINNRKEIKEKLLSIGFVLESREKETDTYFDNLSGEIRTRGQALRVREYVDLITGTAKAQINFKDRKIDQVSMTRTELETEIGQASTIHQILNSIGFHEVCPVVSKIRTTYRKASLSACLDQVENLGDFLELEILVYTDVQYENALHKIEEVLGMLGCSINDTTRTSYLSMLQNKIN